MLGVLQKSWGRFEDVVVKETGASNAPGWGETESSDPNKSHKPGIWWLDCLNKNDLSRGLYLVGNFEYSTYFCRLFFFRQTQISIFSLFDNGGNGFCVFLHPWHIWHFEHHGNINHSCTCRQIYHNPSHGSIMVFMEFRQVVDYLLNKAKDSIEVNAVDDTDKTALHHAARRTLFWKSRWMKGWHWRNLLFFGWQFWERKTWSHTSQIYDKHDGYSWWFQTFFCFPQFFTFTSCLGTRHEILNLTKYFSTGLKSLPSVISRISRLMSRAKLFLCWVAPAHLQEEHFAYIEGHPIIQLSDQLKLILAVQFIPGWWKNSRVFITSQVM